MLKLTNLAGYRSGLLTAIELIGSYEKIRLWKCICVCGKIINVKSTNLRRGLSSTKSCGCLRNKSNKTHGLTNSKEYSAWAHMKSRCFDINNLKYPRYGGRGITVCERWLKFENFLADMGFCPSGFQLDRINNNGNYEKTNCRWTTRAVQQSNTSRNIYLFFNGKNQTLAQWSRELSIPSRTIEWRRKRGFSIQEILRI